jgi:hypothetical protein
MMAIDLIQDGVVTLVAVAAATLVIRRVAGSMRKSSEPKCSNCASGCEPAPGTAQTGAAATHPLVVVRKQPR